MMKLLTSLLALLAVITAQTVSAQSWTSGAEVAPTWSSTSAWTPPIGVDSVHPADSYEPAIIDQNGYTRDQWVNGDTGRSSIGTVAKFRTECKPTFTKRADPLLFPGQYPAGHSHTFFGPMDDYVISNVQNFDYAMGRNYPASRCQGGPLNSTLYWEPSIMRTIGSVNFVVMPYNATFYYTLGSVGEASTVTRLRRNYRFIGGANPMDYNDTKRRKEYSDAGLEYPGSPDTAPGFGGISCHPGGGNSVPVSAAHAMKSAAGIVSTVHARYLKGAAGEDPWAGACTTGHIVIIVNAPQCWDGTNLSSPDGRSHVRYKTRRSDGAYNNLCPTNWVQTLAFETKVFVDHNGWESDLKHWWMSSDRMRMASTECPDATAPCDGVSGGNVPATVNGVYYSRVSKDPCRASGVDFCSFSTAHFDWWGSWDDAELVRWQRNCGGLTIAGTTTSPADCGSGGTDNTRHLLTGGTPPAANLSSNPINSITGLPRATGTTEGQRYFPIRADDQSQGVVNQNVGPNHHN